MTTNFNHIEKKENSTESKTVGYEVKLQNITVGFLNVYPNSSLGIVLDKVAGKLDTFTVLKGLEEQGFEISIAIKDSSNPTASQTLADEMLAKLGL